MTSSPATAPTRPAAAHIVIRPFQASDAKAFYELNQQWISELFRMEEHDHHQLRHPEENVLAPGGHILIADDGQAAVGCVALIPAETGVFEVAKMAVAPKLRGAGVGRRLLEQAIAHARSLGAKTLTLESSHLLLNAVHLYESVGFRHLPPEERPRSPYTRATVFMRMELDDRKESRL